eukprot:symbB.v1.2.030932.t1/scaffold3536.1/size54463/2
MNLQASSQAFCGYDLEAAPESGSGFKRLKRLDLLPLRLKTISQESFSYMAWPQIETIYDLILAQNLYKVQNYTSEHNAAYVAKPASDEILSLCQGPSTLRSSCPKERTKLLHSLSQTSLASCSTSGSLKGIMSSDSLSPLADEAEFLDQATYDFEVLEIGD